MLRGSLTRYAFRFGRRKAVTMVAHDLVRLPKLAGALAA